MNRDAILVYLRDIRDLEVAKYYIAELYDEGRHNKYKELENLKKSKKLLRPKFKHYPAKPGKPDYDLDPFFIFIGACLTIWGILDIVMLCFDNFDTFKYQLDCWSKGNGLPLIINILFFMIPGLIGIIYLTSVLVICIQAKKAYDKYCKIYEKEYKEIEQYNQEKQKEFDIRLQQSQSLEAIRKNNEEYNKLEKQWDNYLDYLKKEENKVQVILDNEYNLNLIPKDYRELASIYYIYEYMSTSQESLTDTLLHTHIEDGIRRIEGELDFIIQQNKEIIFQNRQIINNTRQLQENTTRMLYNMQRQLESQEHILESQEHIEHNTREAAYYTRIASNYSEANAYFSLANYLKD